MRTEQKHRLALRRRWRVRQKISGTKTRPRMSVCFTNKNIHVQFIDDEAGATLAAVSTNSKATPNADQPRGQRRQRQDHRHPGGPGGPGPRHQASGIRPRRRALPWQGQSPGRPRRAKQVSNSKPIMETNTVVEPAKPDRAETRTGRPPGRGRRPRPEPEPILDEQSGMS